MAPVDTFLRSVRDAFHPNDETPAWVWMAVVVFVLTSVVGVVVTRLRRRQVAREAFTRFLAGRKVSPAQVALIDRLARQANVPPRSMATHIDVFERATALELARHTPSLVDGAKGIFEQVGTVRRALGFEGIAGHFAMLTTRELSAGQAVEVAGARATVTEVTEAYFAAVAPASTSFPVGPPGSRVRVTFVRDQEARYETRCTLMALQRGEQSQRLVLGHDEQPTRIQLRKSVRVTVRGPVHLNAVAGAHVASQVGSNDGDDPSTLGEGALVDISVGGAAVDTSLHVAVGSFVRVAFQLDGTAYHDLLAFVLECRVTGHGKHHMRLEFRNLAQVDERQLAASVAHYSAHPFTEPSKVPDGGRETPPE